MASKRHSPTVSFRIGSGLFDALSDESEALGQSAGERARQIVTSVLRDEHRLQFVEEVGEVRTEIEGLRKDVSALRTAIATALEAVLVNVRTDIPDDDIRAWVTENLRG